MTYLIIKDGVVINCVFVLSLNDVVEFYPDHVFVERTGIENVGWTYDGETFTSPAG